MGIWMYSSISLLVILGIFTFIIIAIIKGKKLTMLKKDFVNNMTHELKTPIANISVASQAIRDDKINLNKEKLQKYADIIYKENDRLHLLVERVLQISSMEKKEESLQLAPCELHTIINEVITSFDATLNEVDGIVSIHLKASNSTINADLLHISNVLFNLIDNAIKYSENSPKILVKTENLPNGILLFIEDNGVGISDAHKDKIYDKFYRAQTGNVHNTKGHGLGLSYVKLIIEKHNGSISFSKNSQNGTTFRLFLPHK
jgi:two-component system phosphate regulon sensor histidine kinase PhoR